MSNVSDIDRVGNRFANNGCFYNQVIGNFGEALLPSKCGFAFSAMRVIRKKALEN